MKEKTISSKTVYKCSFLTLYEDKVLLPNNETSQRVYIKHPGAGAVLPITSEGNIILTKQYRYPIRDISIEIPAGKKDLVTESGFECVKRELEEETGYQSNNIQHVYDIHNCVGYSDELIEMFVAYDCYKVENPLQPDDDEFIDVVIYTVNEVKKLIKENTITDVKTILIIQHYLLNLED